MTIPSTPPDAEMGLTTPRSGNPRWPGDEANTTPPSRGILCTCGFTIELSTSDIMSTAKEIYAEHLLHCPASPKVPVIMQVMERIFSYETAVIIAVICAAFRIVHFPGLF